MDSKSQWTDDKRDEIVRWLAVALKDRQSSNTLIGVHELENAVYFLQQSSEKLLKAFLYANDATIKKTHSIDALVISAALIDPKFLQLSSKGMGSTEISKMATYYRYPNLDGNDHSSLEEVSAAIEFTNAVFARLEPFFGDDIWDRALLHARQKSNPFKTTVPAPPKDDDAFSKSKHTNRPKG